MGRTSVQRSALRVQLALMLASACAEGGSSPTRDGDETATSPVVASSAPGRSTPAVVTLREEECEDACANLVRITLSELGETAFRLPPDALARPRADCLADCREATDARDVARMRCLLSSSATSTGELTSECGIDLREGEPSSTTAR